MHERILSKRMNISSATEISIILLLLHNIPYVGFHTPAVLYGILVLLAYMLIIYEAGRGIRADLGTCFAIIGLLSLTFISESFSGGKIIKNAYGLLQVFLYPYLGSLIIKYDFGKTTSRLFWIVTVSYFVTAITTYYGCQIVPHASRILASSTMLENSGYESIIKNLNIAGFFELYTIALLTPMVIMMIRRKTINLILGFALLVAFGLAVIASEYTTALFVFILSLLLFFLPKDYSKTTYIRTLLIMILLGAINIVLLTQLLSYLSTVVDSVLVSDRLNDMSSLLSGRQEEIDDTSDMLKRQDLYYKSINTFVLHPLGAWDPKLTGGHSFILDSLARYGVWGLFLLILMYKRIIDYYIKPFRKTIDFGYIIISFIWVVFLAIVNTGYNIMFICFLMPLFYKYSQGKM